MSKTAHKTANRSAMKQAWNHIAPKLRVVAPATVSWWAAASAPDQRAEFIELAHERDKTIWSSVVPHATNPQGEFR